MNKKRSVQINLFGNNETLPNPKKPAKDNPFLPNRSDYLYTGFSFGGGVQSTALWLMIKHQPERLIKAVGHLPEKAYFADTQDEPLRVYEHIQELTAKHPSIPLDVFSEMSIDSELGRTFPPYFVELENGKDGMLPRQCTERLKILPIQARIAADVCAKSKLDVGNLSSRSVSLWMGISIDEASRMRTNPKNWIQNVYPLIVLGMDRTACYSLCAEYGIYPPPKSACRRCPYRQDWAAFKREFPEDFAIAVQVDAQLRSSPPSGLKRPAYLHRSLLPLNEAVVNQGSLTEGFFDDGFQNECIGMCGV